MPRFAVSIRRVLPSIVVEAETREQAASLIFDIIRDVGPLRDGSLTTVGTVEATEADRLSTITCSHCGKQTLKESWGPGCVRCPACGMLELSPAQFVRFEIILDLRSKDARRRCPCGEVFVVSPMLKNPDVWSSRHQNIATRFTGGKCRLVSRCPKCGSEEMDP